MSAERAERERIAAEALRASLWATLCDHEESDPYDAAGPNGGLVIVPTDTVRALCDAADEVERLTSLVNAKQSWIDGAKVDLDGYADDQAEYEVAVRAIAAERDASRTAHAALVADLRAQTVDEWADLLIAEWKRVDPTSDVAKYPVSYVATFADLARAVIAHNAALLDRHAPEEGR